MISISEARSILFNSTPLMPVAEKPVPESCGYILSENIFSDLDIPLFNQSAMDGFAVNVDPDQIENDPVTLPVIAEIPAGSHSTGNLKRNTAARIFTGSAVPENTTCVVRQEKADFNGDQVTILKRVIAEEGNIRPKGSQIKKSDLAFAERSYINPATVGFLSALGITHLPVFDKPRVSVLSTGNELIRPGDKFKPGQIFESNSFMLKAALEQNGFECNQRNSVTDNEPKLQQLLLEMLETSDVVVVTGGISVGKYDLVKTVLENLGVNQLFYKVKQKPGKPLFAGKRDNKLVFALPGNPAAALVCYYQYVLPSLKKMSGNSQFEPEEKQIPLAHSFRTKGNRDTFFKAKIKGEQVKLLYGQGSDMLRSFAEADALVLLQAGNHEYDAGRTVTVYPLP